MCIASSAPADTSGPGGAFESSGGAVPGVYYEGRTSFEGWGVAGNLRADLSDDLQLTSITAYRQYRAKWDNDDDLSPLVMVNITNDMRFWQFSQELRLNGSIGDDLEYTVGGFYMKGGSRSFAASNLRNFGLPPFVNHDPVNARWRWIAKML